MGHTAFCAEEYDSKICQTLPFYREFYQQVADVIETSGKKQVSWLDIGCGTGSMYEAARERISMTEFIFTDSSAEMLDIARNRFRENGCFFKQMSVLELEDREKYDVITAILVHHYLTQQEREMAVGKCLNALKKGGFFFSFENIAPNSEAGREIFLRRWQKYQVRNGKSEEAAGKHSKRYGTGYFPIPVEAHFELMKRCGFQAVELVWMSYMQAGFLGIKK